MCWYILLFIRKENYFTIFYYITLYFITPFIIFLCSGNYYFITPFIIFLYYRKLLFYYSLYYIFVLPETTILLQWFRSILQRRANITLIKLNKHFSQRLLEKIRIYAPIYSTLIFNNSSNSSSINQNRRHNCWYDSLKKTPDCVEVFFSAEKRTNVWIDLESLSEMLDF